MNIMGIRVKTRLKKGILIPYAHIKVHFLQERSWYIVVASFLEKIFPIFFRLMHPFLLDKICKKSCNHEILTPFL